MEAERSDAGGGGGGEAEVVDEFACAGMLRGSLTSLHGTVERIFGVAFDIGEREASPASDGQIWLKLQGRESGVRAAKLFVKGVVNQEEQQEVSYPAVLHCVFCGARGLFTDSLIRNTSAQIVAGSVGYLLISGLAEPVVRAYSLITDLVEKHECTQSRSSEAAERGSSESLDSRRAFKALVEKWHDRHTLDLLVLPGAVKEVLLDLVRESGLGRKPGDRFLDGKWDSGTSQWDKGTTAASSGNPEINKDLQAESTEERLLPQEPGDRDQQEQQPTVDPPGTEEPRQDDEQELQFLLLLKFFTAMGYTEGVVKRVLARTGPKEASQILDLVQQEQDRNDQEEQAGQGGPQARTLGQRERNRPCESEHSDEAAGGPKWEFTNGEIGEGANGSRRDPQRRREEDHEEDFVLGVLKKAAVSCGYEEQKVAQVYNMLPHRSTHHLLLELQKDEKQDGPEPPWDGPREVDEVLLETAGASVGAAEGGAREAEASLASGGGGGGGGGGAGGGGGGAGEPVWRAGPSKQTGQAGVLDRSHKDDQFAVNHHSAKKKQPPPHQNPLAEVKGPPTSTYSSSSSDPTHAGSAHNQPSVAKRPPQPSSSVKQALQSSVPPGREAPTARAKERRGGAGSPSVGVTGEQRFLEGLQTPFDLHLTDEPGDPQLRTIIIDGSNVAMSHGLGHFFSCRGIALAVQHFWDRGHRHITALLPQWRQKNDSKNKEQHYLTELQTLGLLSYTPSREVQGKRISSYDDRFMLQHAQKTDGVIVTNDNLRDLLDDSPAWRDIIKKRLLQYTFVGDHFMVPDDPLGRGGPHLNDFLRLNHSNPHPGSHSFAGTANACWSPRPPRSQTEVLNFRDRTAVISETMGGGPGRDRPGPTDRSLQETACLREQLCQVFAGQDSTVVLVLQCHPAERDVNVLSDLILEQQKD